MNWTDERIEDLKTLWSDGLSCSQIAESLGGITRNAVIGKVTRLGLDKRKPHGNERSSWQRQPVRTGKRGQDGGLAFRLLKAQRPKIEQPQPIPMTQDQDIPIEQRKTLLELTNETCKWPVGDPGKPDFFFCGGESVPGLPYCIHHGRVAYAGYGSGRRAA